MTPAIKLRFGKPSRGWLPTTLTIEEREYTFDVSYLPYDFVAELTAALSGVLDAPGEYVARICEEPTEFDWRFRSSDASAVTFDVVRYRTGRRTEAEPEVVADVRGTPLDIVRPLWRGLREVASRAHVEAFRSHWGERFPHDAIGRLTEQIEQSEAVLSEAGTEG